MATKICDVVVVGGGGAGAQVITAAGAGSAAAIGINADLVQEDVERAASSGA